MGKFRLLYEFKITQSSLKRLYMYYNNLLFDGKLPNDIKIEIKNINGNVGARAFPNYVAGKWEFEKIEINNKFINSLNEKEFHSILVHEMIHGWTYITQTYNSKNIHKGEFLRKAKEIENKTELKVIGTTLSNELKDYKHLDQVKVYLVFFVWKNDFGNIPQIPKNSIISDFKFYSYDQKNINQKAKEDAIKKRYMGYYIYEINANTPNFMYDDFIKKYINKNVKWLAKGIKQMLSITKKDKINAKLIYKEELTKNDYYQIM